MSPRKRSSGGPAGGAKSSSKAVIALAVMGTVVALYGWNAMFLGPRNKARATVGKELSAARLEEQDLRTNMAQLRKLATDTQSREAELARLGRLVPADADMDGAILVFDDVAKQAQVSMTSFVPSPPAPAAGGGPATVALTLTIDGTFDQLFDYLRRVEGLDRLVVIDSLQLAGGSGAGAPGAGPSKLSAQIRARLFAATGPAPPAATAASPTPANPDSSKTAALPKAGG